MVPTRQYSSKDLPGYTQLHERQKGAGNYEDVEQIDYRQKLLTKERELQNKKKKEKDDLNSDFTETHDIPTIKSLEYS